MEALANPSLESTYTGASRWIVRLLPSLTDLAFILPALWLFIRMDGSATLLSDGDTGWHIRTGQWIWLHRIVPTADLFSFTRPHEAWYAWEWLWDLLFAGIHQQGGLGAVAFVNVCLLGLVSVVLFRLIRRTTDNDLLSFALTVLAMAGSTVHWLARPHIFTWLFVLGFAHALLSAKRGNRSALLWLPLGMILWTNLHGAFFIGIIMLLLVAAGEIIAVFLHAQHFWDAAYQCSRDYLGCALACALATFVNPYGWQLHSHIVSYVSDSHLLDKIGEYQSISFHHPMALLFEALLLLALLTVFWAGLRKQYADALGLILWAHLALLSARNIPIFVFLAAPPVALMVQDLGNRIRISRRLGKPLSVLSHLSTRIRPIERTGRLYVCSAASVLLLAMAFAAGLPKFEARFNEKTFPGSALPFIREAGLSRLFTTDTWASYFVYNLYPHQPSFMDGRSDYFGNDFLEQYAHIIEARWDWEQSLNRYSVDSVALRPDIPLVTVLKASRNWQLLFDDGSVVVFAHAQAPLLKTSASALQVSPSQLSGRKKLGPSQPGLIVKSKTESQERRS